MSLANMINWVFDYLQKNTFEDNTLDKIKHSYVEYCNANSISIPADNELERQLKACLQKLEIDGHAYSLKHSEDIASKKYMSVLPILGNPLYSEMIPKSPEELEEERHIEKYNRQIKKAIKRAERNKKIKDWVYSHSSDIVIGLVITVVGGIIVLIIQQKWFNN